MQPNDKLELVYRLLVTEMQADRLSERERRAFPIAMQHQIEMMRSRSAWKSRGTWVMGGVMFIGSVLGGLLSNSSVFHK